MTLKRRYMAGRPKSLTPRDKLSPVRFTEAEQEQVQQQMEVLGLKSLSEYIRYLHKQQVEASAATPAPVLPLVREYPAPTPFITTERGTAYLGDSLGLLHNTLAPKSVDLIMTSPPFGLVREKAYGNEKADDYLDWFRPFAEGFMRVLKPTGSVAIDIGGAWKPGQPTRSLYHFELLIMLCKEYGFHLALEHFWWNPAKLPSPAEWVNVRRVRVKDAVNCVWWLSPTPFPKASNKRVLAPYSDSMKSLIKNGYQHKLRPSGHDISDRFGTDHGGSVPPNLIAAANTESNGRYQSYCREQGLPIHPARFPYQLPEYFIRMCTNPGDLVVDPFGGSCMTGEVCERLGRHWVCGELDENYLRGAQGRFIGTDNKTPKVQAYTIYPPAALPVRDDVLLPEDGGRKRAVKPEPSAEPVLAEGTVHIGEIGEQLPLITETLRKRVTRKKPVVVPVANVEVPIISHPQVVQVDFHSELAGSQDAVEPVLEVAEQ